MLAEVVGKEESSSFFPSPGTKAVAGAGNEVGHGQGSSHAAPQGAEEELDVQRAAHSAPTPFFRSQKWATPDSFLAANRSTAAGAPRPSSQMRPPRFPLSRLVLWDRTAFGEAVDVDPKDFVPRLQFTWNALSDILHEARRGTPSFVVGGTMDGRGLGQRITLETVKEEKSLEDSQLASVSGATSTLGVEFLSCSSEDDVSGMQDEVNIRLEENLRSSLDSIHGFGTAALLPIICSCCTTKGSKSKELRVNGSLLLPCQRLTLQPIYPLLTCNTTLSQSLFSVLKKERAGAIRQAATATAKDRTGFLSMDQGHRLLPLLENEPLAKEMPLLGVWVACGASGVRSPLVWAACLRFVNSKSIVERALQSGAFLLLLFASGSGAPQCFECTFETKKGDSSVVSFKEKEGLPACVRHSFQSEVYPEDLKEEAGIVFSSDFGGVNAEGASGADEGEDHEDSSEPSLSSFQSPSPKDLAGVAGGNNNIDTPPPSLVGGKNVRQLTPDATPPVPRPSVPTPSHPTPSQNLFTPAGTGGKDAANIADFLFSPYPRETPRENVRKEIMFEQELADLTNQPSYWSPYTQAAPHSSSKLQGAAANSLISQQQQQLSLLQDQMKQLQQQLENVMKNGSGNLNANDKEEESSGPGRKDTAGGSVELAAAAEGVTATALSKAPINQGGKETETDVADGGGDRGPDSTATTLNGGEEETTTTTQAGLRSASTSTSTDHGASSNLALGFSIGGGAEHQDLDMAAAAAAVAGAGSSSSSPGDIGLSVSNSDDGEEEGDIININRESLDLGTVGSAPAATFIPKVRYIPLSDEESEDEEELKILSKYLGQANILT